MKKLIAIIILIATFTCLISCQETKNKVTDDIFRIPGEETTKNSRIISFETNGGNRIDSIDLNQFEGQMPIPKKANHDFLGWFKDEALTIPVQYPFRPEGDITVYAKWIKIRDYIKCKNTKIKNESKTWDLDPNGFDLEELQKNGYNLQIELTYDVYYKQTYDAILDIGYMGAPEYEIYMKKDNTTYASEEEVTATKSVSSKSLTLTTNAAVAIKSNYKLTISTNNIQNEIYFENIIINYRFYK